jgi:CBS domain containing-hemolysin-like protein
MDDSIPRSILIILLILISGIFEGFETALSYSNKLRIKKKAEEGNMQAKRVNYILNHFDKALSALLIGTNVCQIFASSFAAVLAVKLFGALGGVISTIVLTLLMFFIAETIPKSIAKVNSDAYASVFSLLIAFLMLILTPVTLIFEGLGRLVKLMLPKNNEQPSITEDEFTTIVENIKDEGMIEPVESEIIRSAVEFSDISAHQVMTPLNKMVAVSITETPGKLKELILGEKYSRLPVYAGSPDRIVGVLQARDCLWRMMNGLKIDIGVIMKLPYYISPEMKLDELFEGLGRRRTHMAIVTDSNGTALGFVTMEDLLEELVGEIYDEDDDIAEGSDSKPPIKPFVTVQRPEKIEVKS